MRKKLISISILIFIIYFQNCSQVGNFESQQNTTSSIDNSSKNLGENPNVTPGGNPSSAPSDDRISANLNTSDSFDLNGDILLDTSEGIRQRIVSGDILVFRFMLNYAKAFASSDDIVLGWKNDKMNVALVGKLKASAYLNSVDEIVNRNILSIWGAKFELIQINGKYCLSRNGQCYAKLLGSIFNKQFRPSLYEKIISLSIAELSYAQTQNLQSMCVINGKTIYPTYVRFRDLGQTLQRVVPLINIIPFEDTRIKLWSSIQQAMAFLSVNYNSNFSKTDYFTCSNSTEFMTGYLVMYGLSEVFKFTPTVSLKNYIGNIFSEINSSSLANSVRISANSAPNTDISIFANAHAQYLGMHLIMKKVSNRALESHLDGVVKNIIGAQSLNNSRSNNSFRYNQDRCLQDGGGNYTLQFGGWAHGVHLWNGNGDCRQSMGYHALTVNPLLEFIKEMNRDSSICNSISFKYSCTQIRWSLRAALAYLTNPKVLDSKTGYYFGHAYLSASDAMFKSGSYWGSWYGVDYGLYALASLNFASTQSSFDISSRVTRDQILASLFSVAEFIQTKNINYNYLASLGLLKFYSLTKKPIEI